MTGSTQMTYSIKTAALLVDMNSHTIRAWERRYKALDPNRNEANNRREYTPRDVERLMLLSKLVKAGHQISLIANLDNDILMSMTSRATPSAPDLTPSTEDLILRKCLDALASFELVYIQSELENARHFLPAMKFLDGIALPLIREIGMGVSTGRFSIAQEHALSAILRAHLMQILYSVRKAAAIKSHARKDPDLSICVATRDGDHHEFGILAAAIIVALYGHRPHYFGVNIPASALADAARAVKADVILVGNSQSSDPNSQIRQHQYVEDLRARLPAGTPEIWWGGVAAAPMSTTGSMITPIPTLDDLTRKLR